MLQPPSDPSVDALYVGTGADGQSRAADRLTARRVTTAGDALAALDAGVTDCVRVASDAADTDLLAHRIDEAVASHRTERRLRTERSQHR